MKILPVRAEPFCVNGQAYRQSERYTDGRTNAMQIIVAFRYFANVPKNQVCNFRFSQRVIEVSSLFVCYGLPSDK